VPNFVAIGQTVAEIYTNFWIFKMAAATILYFKNFTLLTVGTIKEVELRHCAKLLRNRSNRGQDMPIFRFFQDGGRPPSWISDACVGAPTKGIWWYLLVCKIWLESI